MIYFDNAATTKIHESILEAMLPWLTNNFGNASSIYSLGRQARVAIEEARNEIAAAIGAHPAELIFTSGGTESNNTILKSCLQESSLSKSLAVSAVEHHAVLHPAEALEQSGVPVTIIPVNSLGNIDLHFTQQAATNNALVSIMHANNETGIIQPIRAIKESLPENALLHTDAVQSLGKIQVNVQDLLVDFLTISAHKIHGPKGIGAMFIRKGIDFKAHQQGGGQERNRRAGTESPALIVGFQVAVRNAIAELESSAKHMRSLQNTMRTLIMQHLPDARINTPNDESQCLPSILNVSFPHEGTMDGEAILQMMDIQGIAVSNGSACVSGSPQPSHVLKAMGLPDNEAKAAVRFSFSKDNQEHEVVRAVEVLVDIINGMKN